MVAASQRWGDLLDELAFAVFGGAEGERRLAAISARYDEIVGAVHPDDPYWELFQAHRVDWALCDADIPGGAGVGDTWLARAIANRIPGVVVTESQLAVRSTYCGLFEIWPASTPFLRDRLRGLCVPLADDVEVEPGPRGEPSALWELRVIFEHGHARLCRPPLPYPLELLELLDDAEQQRWRDLAPPLGALWLRRALLRFVRAARIDPKVVFVPALRSAAGG